MAVLPSALLVGTLLLPFVAPQRYIDEFSRRQDGGNEISGMRWASSTRRRSSGSSRRSGNEMSGIRWAGNTRGRSSSSSTSGRRNGNGRGNGFDLGRTPDGEEGYIGINGGENGMPWMGGSGPGELHSDGGARLGRGSGVGSGSIWAYRQRVDMGIDDPFPHMTGPPPSEVLRRNQRRSGRTGTRRRTNSMSRTGGASMMGGRPRHSMSSSDRIRGPHGGRRFGGRPMPIFPSGFGMFPQMMPFRPFPF